MRRRFGRRGRRGPEDRHAPIDVRWLERIVEAGLAPVEALEARRYEDVPDTLVLMGVGANASGERCVVAYAPRTGSAAVLGAVVSASRMAEEDGFAGRALAIAPEWSDADRQLLGSLGALPFDLQAVSAPALQDDGAAVRGRARPDASLTSPARVGAALGDPAARALFGRAVDALRGLAAKHQGALRGVGSGVELVVLARRTAVLRPEGNRVVLETLQPSRDSAELSQENLGEVLDRLEGAVRKRLNDRRIRDGEEGRRGSLRSALAAAASLRDVRSWPMPGSDPELLDLLGVDDTGRLCVGVVRDHLDLASLTEVLVAAAGMDRVLAGLSQGLEPPVRSDPPRLLLAAGEFTGAALLALSRTTLNFACFDVQGSSVRVRDVARPSASGAPARAVAERAASPRPVAPEPDHPARLDRLRTRRLFRRRSGPPAEAVCCEGVLAASG